MASHISNRLHYLLLLFHLLLSFSTVRSVPSPYESLASDIIADFASRQPNGKHRHVVLCDRRAITAAIVTGLFIACTGPTLHAWQGYTVSSKTHNFPALFSHQQVSHNSTSPLFRCVIFCSCFCIYLEVKAFSRRKQAVEAVRRECRTGRDWTLCC